MSGVLSYRDGLKQAMTAILRERKDSIVLGQGVTDPTGIFGTTKGLAAEFGEERLFDVPISEESMMGIALGAALNGVYPIQTHIRVDFLLLAMNQLVNLVAKYKYMYGGSFEAPMLIRAVVGRSWGQGPQHSQSLQALFSHVPGLLVLMPSTAHDAYESYVHAARTYRGPVLAIEHRFLYDLTFATPKKARPDPFSARVVREGSDVTIVATSYMVQEAQLAADWVKTHKGISVEIIDPHVVSRVDHDLIQKSVARTGRLLVADTGWAPYGVAAEVSRGVVMRDPSALKRPLIALGMQHVPAPTSHALEKYFYPDMGSIVDAIYALASGREKHGETLPDEEHKKKLRVSFKGPF